MHGEHVRLLDAARIDALMRLDRRQRGQTVAVDRGALEVERGGGLFHFLGKLVLDRLAAAGQKPVRFAHQHRIIAKIDLLGAWRRTAFDLIEQARPRPALEERIAARAQQEGALQRIDGAIDRPYRRERPVIMARPRARAAMLEDLRRPMIGCDQNIGKRFVVAQHHVEARPQPLDEIGFEQQRLGLGAGDDEFERAGGGDHALDAGVEPGRTRIGLDALFDVLGLADIEHVAAAIDHAINAGPRRRELGTLNDRGAAGGERTPLLIEGRLRGFGRIGLRQRLLVVFLDDLGLGRDLWFRGAHAGNVPAKSR